MTARSFKATVKPAMLRWARSTAGLTDEQLARTAGVSLEKWQAWESGRQAPTFRQLEKIAHRCRRPVALFYLPAPPEEPPLPADYRQAGGAGGRPPLETTTLLAIRKARWFQSVASGLQDLRRSRGGSPMPHVASAIWPTQTAAQLRAELGVTVADQIRWKDIPEALRNWRSLIEQTGILVFQFPMEQQVARGFSLWDERVPAIVLNSKDSPAGRCFTLFHETAHLFLRKPGICIPHPPEGRDPNASERGVERFCDGFAIAFLAPLDDPVVQRQLRLVLDEEGQIAPDAAAAAALRLKISREALLWRLVDAGLSHPETVRRQLETWRNQTLPSSPGGFPPPARRSLSQRGHAFTSIILDALDQGRITSADASDYLELSTSRIEEVRRMLAEGAPHDQ